MDTEDGGSRPLVRTRSLDEYRKEPDFAQEGKPPVELTLYPGYAEQYKQEAYAWGMTIDLGRVRLVATIALSPASPKIIFPSSAKSRFNKGRHMHWLRVDAYYQGDRDNPKAYFQPVPCMQCENAPCETGMPGRLPPCTQHRGPERHGLQPLRGHAVLLEQLSVQGTAL